MEFWFSERHTDNVELSIRVEKQLFSGQSDFQRIDVFDSVEFGRFLTSDGNVIFSEKDEFTYDEMIVHVPMAVHPNVKKVLVIDVYKRQSIMLSVFRLRQAFGFRCSAGSLIRCSVQRQ